MGTCLSKKKPKPSSSSTNLQTQLSSLAAISVSTAVQPSAAVVPLDPKKEKEIEAEAENEEAPAPAKKEVFLIKHRKSHDERERNSKPISSASEEEETEPAIGAVVRTSSCTKEEVDAILIQCGRLSRSSSGKAASSSASLERGGGRRYSGSKRSFDFDNGNGNGNGEDSGKNESGGGGEDRVERYGRHRRSARGSPSPQGRRRTPSREREQGQRSSSRERRVSRSPGRRANLSVEAGESGGVANRPGKMVSVPATVTSSLVMDRSNNGETASGAVIKRISVKRNVGEAVNSVAARTAASPRSQSPARANGGNGNAKSLSESQQPSLSRNSSRKTDQSPYRRNPLSEIDPNSLAHPQLHNGTSNRSKSRGKREAEGDDNIIAKDASNVSNQAHKLNPGNNQRTTARVSTDNKSTQPQVTVETTTVVISGSDTRPHGVTRSRSGRQSRDFDFTPEALLNANSTPSYTRLLLEDIQSFHQKNTTTTATVVSLPPCVSKACSILEAVADLNNNSTAASSNLSCAFSEDNHHYSKASSNNNSKSSLMGSKDPFVATEVVGCDHLTEPSFHKYVTVRRGGTGGAIVDAVDDQESSGSNSFAGSSNQLNHWGGLSSSSWEPNSADSTDRWTSRSSGREDDKLSAGRKRESYSSQQHSGGIGRGRLGSAKGLHTGPVVSST